jgi:hypothetical protein
MAMLPINRIPEILKRMDLNTSQAEAMKTCFGILAIMSREDANKALIAKDGMEIMLNAMTVHIDRTDVQEAGCDLLWSLAFNSNAVKELIAKYNGAIVLVRALKRHSRSADFLKSACGALSNICQFRPNQEAVATQGGLQPLVGSIHVHQTNSKLLPFIFDAIASIIVNNEENARGVSSLGIIPIVVSSLSRHKGSKEVVKSGCHTLAILSDVKGQASKIAFAGGVPIILSLLDLHPHYSDLHRVAAVVLLRMLQESAHVGREICCNDGVRILLNSLEQGGAQQDTVAAVTHILYTITNPASPSVASIENQLWCKPSTANTSSSFSAAENNSEVNQSGKLSPARLLNTFEDPNNNGGLPQTALKGVVSVLQQYSSRRDVVRAACRLLSNLSTFENIPIALDALSVLDRIFECIYLHQDAKDVLESSATFMKFINKVKVPNFQGNSLNSFYGILHVMKMKAHEEEIIYYVTDLLKRFIENSRKKGNNPLPAEGKAQPILRDTSPSKQNTATASTSNTNAPVNKNAVNILENEEFCQRFLTTAVHLIESLTQTKESFISSINNPSAATNSNTGSGGMLSPGASQALLSSLPNELSSNSRILRNYGKRLSEKTFGNILQLLEYFYMHGKIIDATPPPPQQQQQTGSSSSIVLANQPDTPSQKLYQFISKLYFPFETYSSALEFLLNYFSRIFATAGLDNVNGSPHERTRKLRELKGPTAFGLSQGNMTGNDKTAGGEQSPGMKASNSLPAIVKSSSASDLNLAGTSGSPLMRRNISRSHMFNNNNPNDSGNNSENNSLTGSITRTTSKDLHHHHHREGRESQKPTTAGGGASNSIYSECSLLMNNKYYPRHPLKLTGTGGNNRSQPQNTNRLLENWPNFLERLLPNSSANSNFPPFRNNFNNSGNNSLTGEGGGGYLSNTEIPSRMQLCYESVRPGGKNIISRCSTPAPYSVPPGGLGKPFEHSLTFESEFESGNLLRAVQVSEASYDLVLRADIHTQGHTQWFYFAVSNTHPMELVKLSEQGVMVPSVRVSFNIINFTKPDSLFNLGMRPVVYSVYDAKHKNIGWVRSGTDISYRGNSFSRTNNAGEGLTTYYTLSFTLEFHNPKDTILITYSYPYTVQDYRLLLSDIFNRIPHPENMIRKLKLCSTLGGEDCDLLIITDFAHDKEKIGNIGIPSDSMNELNDGETPQTGNRKSSERRSSTASQSNANNGPLKPALFISGRVHPGEPPASWMMKGILEFLTSDNSSAKLLRKLFIIFIVPMLNPGKNIFVIPLQFFIFIFIFICYFL